MTEEEFVRAYNLTRYPFARRELCPFRDDTDLPMYALVDGFGTQAATIREKARALKSRAVVLIRGPRASGRSSVANYLAHHLVRPDTHTLQVVCGRAGDHHKTEPIRDALTALYELLDSANGFAGQKALEDDFMAKVIDAKEPATTGSYRVLLKKANNLITALNWTVVFVIEDAKTFDQIDNAAQVFTTSPVVIATTESDEVRNAFRTRSAPDFVVDLAALSQTDVAQLLDVRWEASGGVLPVPFDPAGIARAFAADFPVGPVMDIFAEIVSKTPEPPPTFDQATILEGALQYIIKTGRK
jgi:hypothetical protein